MRRPLFPPITRSYIESCQFSSWYSTFSDVSLKSTVIRPLSRQFRSYLEEDCVIIPDGSEDVPATSSLSDKTSSDDEDADDTQKPRHVFPELDAQIRDTIVRYEAVFPKLNWTSPKDASWVVPTLKCTTPADVYLLLKSSDFVTHDIDSSLAFEGCSTTSSPSSTTPTSTLVHDLELVLKKWYLIDRAREFRCFVREEILIGVAQRDPNYYPYLNEEGTKDKIVRSISSFWANNVRTKFPGGKDYVFDIYLTRDLTSGHILDFNPYHPKTDPLLFTYEELLKHLESAPAATSSGSILYGGAPLYPMLRTIPSASHPIAARNAPLNQHNAVPFDALQISTGNDIATFSKLWGEKLKEKLDEESETSSTTEENQSIPERA